MGYETDLNDSQILEPFFSGKNRGSHLRKHDKRELVNAVLYLNRSGCQWRLLPKDFPPYVTVWSFYHRAVISGLWERIKDALVVKSRVAAGRNVAPTYAIIDSQSVKTPRKNAALTGEKNKGAEAGRDPKPS